MRATVGLPISRSRSCMSLNAPNHFQYRRGLSSSSAPQLFRSAPTQNARPSPVMTTTRMSSSQLASSKARASSRSILKSNAFSTSGRLSVTVARWPAFSYRIRSKPSSAGSSGSGESGSGNLDELHGRHRQPTIGDVLARGHELVAPDSGLEGVRVGELVLGVVRMRLRTHGRARDLAVAEDRVRDLLRDLDVPCVRIGVRRLG